MLIPSPQFEIATITNIDNRFGATSASDAFYKKTFNLYNAAPGASSPAAGSFTPGDLGCVGPVLGQLLGSGVPCVMHFLSDLSNPSQDALTSVRVDWNLAQSDRVSVRLQHDSGYAVQKNAITPLFEGVNRQSWRQGQAIETHTFSSSAANQFLFAYAHIGSTNGVADIAKAVPALGTHIFFNPPEQLSDLGNSFQTRNGLVQYQISEDFVSATRRPSLISSARYTSPIPPLPRA